MTDVLLIQPPIKDFYLTAKRTIPYGLACIASTLIEEGFSVEILDCLATSKSRIADPPPDMTYLIDYYGMPDVTPFALFHHFKRFGCSDRRIAETASKSGAFLVGVSSLFTAYSEEAMAVAEISKSALPNAKVVMGGHHATELPEAVMNCAAVDFVLRGEGEASMPVLARALMAGADISAVPGIVYRPAEGGLRINPPAVMEDPDRYPLPASHLLNERFYRRRSGTGAVVIGSRGCPLGCTYCSTSSSSYLKYRRRSVVSVLREIDHDVSDRGVRFIDFEDENISLDRKWFQELLTGIRTLCTRLGVQVELRAMNGLFPPTLDDDSVRAMKEAGFQALNLSLGTTSREQLKRFRRPDVREAFDNALACAQKHGLEAVGYIIVGAPGQDPMDSVSDLLYLAGRNALAGVSVYYPAPGSADFAKCREMGILPEKFGLMRSTTIPISDKTTRQDSATLLRLGRILNFIKSLPDEAQPAPPQENKAAGAAPESLSGPGTSQDSLSREIEWTPAARREAGIRLLRRFLKEGRIFGLTPSGEEYEHRTSRALCDKFIQGIVDLPEIASKLQRLSA